MTTISNTNQTGFKETEILEKFDIWNNQKKALHNKESDMFFREGDIWWISLGMNIKSESFGKGESFRRPALILKKLSNDSCIVIPLSSKIKEGNWFCEIDIDGEKRTALLYQIRMINKNRLQRKMGKLTKKDLGEIKNRLKKLLSL